MKIELLKYSFTVFNNNFGLLYIFALIKVRSSHSHRSKRRHLDRRFRMKGWGLSGGGCGGAEYSADLLRERIKYRELQFLPAKKETMRRPLFPFADVYKLYRLFALCFAKLQSRTSSWGRSSETRNSFCESASVEATGGRHNPPPTRPPFRPATCGHAGSPRPPVGVHRATVTA